MKIALIGTGRIAWHLGKRLKSKGLMVSQVLGRTPSQVQALAAHLGSNASLSWADIAPDTDWILIAVKDDAIDEVGAALSAYAPAALATHTSGATPSTVLSPFFERYGVFYPLQTFSHERSPVWSKIPFCVDASNETDLLLLKKMAKTIGNLVYQVNDDQRKQLHVAAVFANNFANHCFSVAEQILNKHNLPFDLLHPLMEETLAKALQDSPVKMQTGPAIRNDQDTINRHLSLLETEPIWQDLYALMTQSIRANQSISP